MHRRHSMVALATMLGFGLVIATQGIPGPILAADVAGDTALGGSPGGSFTATPLVLEACKEYTLWMNYNVVPGGTPNENQIGFQLWNDQGSAQLTDHPYGQRKWQGDAQRYYLESLRRTDQPSMEGVNFKVDCSDAHPSYTVRIFNYGAGSTLNHSLLLAEGGAFPTQAEQQSSKQTVVAVAPAPAAAPVAPATKGGPVTSLPGGEEN